LFRKETFGGNGRTCETCHSPSTGTRSPEDVQELLAENPNDPLFLHDGLDDGVSGTSRIAEHATIRVVRPAHLGADCGQWRGADHAELLSVDLSQGRRRLFGEAVGEVRLPKRRMVKDHVPFGTGKVWGRLLA